MSESELDRVAEILVVDDVQQNLVAAEAALGGLGCKLVLASSGAEALRYLLERDFALILLDVQMPSMDGLETATMIRERSRTRHVPIIFLTAYGRNDDDVLSAYRLGAVDFLFKPINPEVLRAKASVFVELHRRNVEVARQAAQLKENEELIREKALAAQRRRLEAEALRARISEQKQHVNALSEKNAELEATRGQLERSNARLEEADRKKDEFIAILAHELRNPLAAMVSGLELLHGTPSASEVDSVREVLTRQGSYLTRLVDDLLDVSRLTSGKMKLQRRAVRVDEVIQDALELSRPSLVQTLSVDVDCPDTLIYGDPIRLSQIIVNLLTNAARYTAPEGHVRVTAKHSDGSVVFHVEDDGQGMSAELVREVFDIFVQGEAGREGLGIGLTLVRKLCALHGGSVEARSEGPGRGSCFQVTLPSMKSNAVETTNTGVPEVAEQSERRIRIALIDDHSDLRELTRALLERWGHEVYEAETGEAGIKLVVERLPDLAIIDIGLPDIVGYDVARTIRNELKDQCPRLIALSGYAQRPDRERSEAAGFDLHLSKPVKPGDLRKTLQEQR